MFNTMGIQGPNSLNRSKQGGVAGMAILAAMLVVSVVTAIAVKQSWQSNLDLKRAGFRWMGFQAKAYTAGAEQLAILALVQDLEDDKTDGALIDTKSEFWSQGFTFPSDYGQVDIRVIDAQSRLNINALAAPFNTLGKNTPMPGDARFTAVHRRFLRLLQLIPIDDESETYLSQPEAEAILEAIIDWIDSDQNVTGFGGAEQGHYQQLDIPVTIANAEMASITELMWIKGMTPWLYQRLIPYVSALPAATPLNVNTMHEFIVRTFNIPSILQPLNDVDGQEVASGLSGAELNQVSDIETQVVIEGLFGQTPSTPASGNTLPSSGIDTAGLSVNTEYFELHTTITVGDNVYQSKSMIKRDSNGAKVVRRTDAHF